MGWILKTLTCVLLLLNPIKGAIITPTPHEYLRNTTLQAYGGDFKYRINFFNDVGQYSYDDVLVSTIGFFENYNKNDNIYRIEDGTYCEVINAPRSGSVSLSCGAEWSGFRSYMDG